MNLRSDHWYKSRQVDQASGSSFKSSEESVTNFYHVLEPIVEEKIYSYCTSSMFMDAHTFVVSEYYMAFNMRLAFVKTNNHGAQLYKDPPQLYKDPMNRWVFARSKQEDKVTRWVVDES